MKAIPMRGRLSGKRLSGYLWAGPGKTWMRKENYFQLEHQKMLTAMLSCEAGSFKIRFKGATCEVRMKGADGKVVGSMVLALPRGRKR